MPFQNDGQWSISFRIISILAKIWKTTLPKEFFNEIWVILGDYEYINIAEIKIVKVIFFIFFPWWDFSRKSYFPASPKC